MDEQIRSDRSKKDYKKPFLSMKTSNGGNK